MGSRPLTRRDVDLILSWIGSNMSGQSLLQTIAKELRLSPDQTAILLRLLYGDDVQAPPRSLNLIRKIQKREIANGR